MNSSIFSTAADGEPLPIPVPKLGSQRSAAVDFHFCAWCKRWFFKLDNGIAVYVERQAPALTHGICRPCAENFLAGGQRQSVISPSCDGAAPTDPASGFSSGMDKPQMFAIEPRSNGLSPMSELLPPAREAGPSLNGGENSFALGRQVLMEAAR